MACGRSSIACASSASAPTPPHARRDPAGDPAREPSPGSPRRHEHLERREVADDLGRDDDAAAYDEVLGAADPRHAVDRGVELEAVLAVVGLGLERRPRAGRPLGGAEERLAALDVHRSGVEDEVLGEQRTQRVGPAAVAPGVEVRPRDPGGVLGAHFATRGYPGGAACVILRAVSTADAPASPAPVARLRPPRHRVSPRAIRYWTARAAGGWLVLAVAQVVWLVAAPSDRRWQLVA